VNDFCKQREATWNDDRNHFFSMARSNQRKNEKTKENQPRIRMAYAYVQRQQQSKTFKGSI